MVEDILKFYSLNSEGFSFGLFSTPLGARSWSDKPMKSLHGVSYTQFDDAFSTKVSENLSLFDLFHGYCKDFAAYFAEKNPDWEIHSLTRDTFHQSLVHMYAVKKLSDGRLLFADARGVTDNVIDFFRDFRFGKDLILKVEDRKELLSMLDKGTEIEIACKAGYENIFRAGLQIDIEEEMER